MSSGDDSFFLINAARYYIDNAAKYYIDKCIYK